VIGILAERKERQYVPDLREMLKHGTTSETQALLSALISLEGRAAAKEEVLRHINRVKPEWAAQLLGSLGDASQAPALFKMTDNTDEYVRGAAIAALGQLGARQYLDDLLRWLDDESSDKRLTSAAAIARLGRPEHGAKMLFMLKADDYLVRIQGVKCLQMLGAPEYIKEIRALLKDPHARVRSSAAAALNSLGAVMASELLPLIDPSDPLFCQDDGPMMAVADMALRENPERRTEVERVFKRLEKHLSRHISDGASIALIRLGCKDRQAQREIAQRLATSAPRWRILHYMHLSESLALANDSRLRQSIEIREDVESLEAMNSILKPSGLKVEGEHLTVMRLRKGRRITLFEVVRNVSPPLAPVFENGVITFLHHEADPIDRWCSFLR
jgi:hypothetical protein